MTDAALLRELRDIVATAANEPITGGALREATDAMHAAIAKHYGDTDPGPLTIEAQLSDDGTEIGIKTKVNMRHPDAGMALAALRDLGYDLTPASGEIDR